MTTGLNSTGALKMGVVATGFGVLGRENFHAWADAHLVADDEPACRMEEALLADPSSRRRSRAGFCSSP